MLVSLPVMAQDVTQAELAECAAKATAAEKLACYEALTVVTAEAPVEPEAASPDPAAQAPSETETKAEVAADVPAESVRTPDQTVIEPAAATSVTGAPPAKLRAAPARAAVEPASAPPAAVESRSAVPDDLGMEHLDHEQEKTEPVAVTATVSEVTESHTGRLYFHFSNGQVWRQVEPRRFRYPTEPPFEVTISQGLMGDYRLRVGGEGPMTHIRRVE